nr:WhiB family transcriptional regulator [Actinomycetota bacterium]
MVGPISGESDAGSASPAKRICATCPAREECLMWGLRQILPHVWTAATIIQPRTTTMNTR